jgi:nitric oxide reductase NorD protein
LYFWLAALAAVSPGVAGAPDEFCRNQQATRLALSRWPGLNARYRRLVAAHLEQRMPEERLPVAERGAERAVRQALQDPGGVNALPSPAATPQPVPLWLTMEGAAAGPAPFASGRTVGEDAGGTSKNDAASNAHAATRVEYERQRNGMLMQFRAESLLSMGEYARVNRSEDDDPDAPVDVAARDLDQLAISADGQRTRSRVRFDLDLPSAAEDDIVLGAGISLPEWDYRKSCLLENHVRLIEMSPCGATPAALPSHLIRTARRLYQQFEALRPARRWVKAQADGAEIDLDAVVRATTDRACGMQAVDNVFQSQERRERDLACLVLADLSLSTDAWVSNEARVIDVVRESLLLFGTALTATGDRFALCGFSSVRRNNVRFSRLKDFGAPFGAAERGRVLAIKPGYYTRLGAAIRHASNLLERQAAGRRLLLILSDGKPNDLDLYEGRYGIEDSRSAVMDAKRHGLRPFCVTIDREGPSYLPHVFGAGGYAIIRRPQELPRHLLRLYAAMTR